MINSEDYETVGGARIESEYRRSLKLDRERPSSGTNRMIKDNKVSYFTKLSNAKEPFQLLLTINIHMFIGKCEAH